MSDEKKEVTVYLKPGRGVKFEGKSYFGALTTSNLGFVKSLIARGIASYEKPKPPAKKSSG